MSRWWLTCGRLAARLRTRQGRVVLFVSEVRVIGVRVLGPLQVIVDDVAADVGGPRQRCVLARLIAEHGRVVSADRLIEDVY
jgi:hypothetical protein